MTQRNADKSHSSDTATEFLQENWSARLERERRELTERLSVLYSQLDSLQATVLTEDWTDFVLTVKSSVVGHCDPASLDREQLSELLTSVRMCDQDFYDRHMARMEFLWLVLELQHEGELTELEAGFQLEYDFVPDLSTAPVLPDLEDCVAGVISHKHPGTMIELPVLDLPPGGLERELYLTDALRHLYDLRIPERLAPSLESLQPFPGKGALQELTETFEQIHRAIGCVRLMHRDHLRRAAWTSLAGILLDEAGLGPQLAKMSPLRALRRAWAIGESLEQQLFKEGLSRCSALASTRALFEVASELDRAGMELGLHLVKGQPTHSASDPLGPGIGLAG